MKATVVTISLVIVLSLLFAGTLPTNNNSNLLAVKQVGGDSGHSSNSGDGEHDSKGGDNKGENKGTDNNNGRESTPNALRSIKPGEVITPYVEHCTIGAKCMQPGDGGSTDGNHHHTHDDNNDQVLHIVKDRSSSTTAVPVFKESTDILVETGVSIGPTTKTVDVAVAWLHIVGDIKNNGKSSVTIEPQISGRVMNANKQTIGIEYATPLSTTIQPGQTTAFEMLVGGTGIPNLSDIASIHYHVGIAR
jgi:hypothetical protein